MIDVSKMSKTVKVRKMEERDADAILHLCLSNPLYYQHCPPNPDRSSVIEDLRVCPKGKTMDEKHYVGFYIDNELTAVMDLIENYPQQGIAFIGFFMMQKEKQGSNMGSLLIGEVLQYLKEINYSTVRLAWVKSNPQSEHFWKKNGFVAFKETTGTDGLVLMLAEKRL